MTRNGEWEQTPSTPWQAAVAKELRAASKLIHRRGEKELIAYKMQAAIYGARKLLEHIGIAETKILPVEEAGIGTSLTRKQLLKLPGNRPLAVAAVSPRIPVTSQDTLFSDKDSYLEISDSVNARVRRVGLYFGKLITEPTPSDRLEVTRITRIFTDTDPIHGMKPYTVAMLRHGDEPTAYNGMNADNMISAVSELAEETGATLPDFDLASGMRSGVDLPHLSRLSVYI
jgi:hypothetical protein